MIAPLSKASAAIASLAAITAAGALLFATPALAAWSNPMPLSSLLGDAGVPVIGIDADGNAIVVYREVGSDLYLNTRTADGRTGDPVQITDQIASPPSIAVNAEGTAAIVWLASDGVVNQRLHMRVRHPDGALTPVQLVSQAGIEAFNPGPAVGIDQAGNVLVSWGAPIGGANRTFLRRRNASSGTLGAIQSVSPDTGDHREPRLVVEPGGRAFVSYTSFDGGNGRVFGRARSANGALSDAAAMSTQGSSCCVAVALDGSGRALVAWIKDVGGVLRVQARTRAPNGVRSPISTLSGAASDADRVKVAIGNTGGIGVVSWLRLRGGHFRLESRRIVGGEWQAVETVSPAAMSAHDHALGVSGDGKRATFLFSTSEEGDTVERVRARTRRPDGSFSAADIVSAENGMPTNLSRLSVNANGKAAATWDQPREDEARSLIWVGTNFLQ